MMAGRIQEISCHEASFHWKRQRMCIKNFVVDNESPMRWKQKKELLRHMHVI